MGWCGGGGANVVVRSVPGTVGRAACSKLTAGNRPSEQQHRRPPHTGAWTVESKLYAGRPAAGFLHFGWAGAGLRDAGSGLGWLLVLRDAGRGRWNLFGTSRSGQRAAGVGMNSGRRLRVSGSGERHVEPVSVLGSVPTRPAAKTTSWASTRLTRHASRSVSTSPYTAFVLGGAHRFAGPAWQFLRYCPTVALAPAACFDLSSIIQYHESQPRAVLIALLVVIPESRFIPNLRDKPTTLEDAMVPAFRAVHELDLWKIVLQPKFHANFAGGDCITTRPMDAVFSVHNQ